MPSNNIQISQSTFETIDTAVYNFVNGQLDIYTKTNNGLSKVPVLWLGAERAHQIKNNKDLRDKVGKLKLPLLTISRTGVSRDTDFRGSYRSYYPPDVGPEGGRVAITRIIRQDKTRNFANSSRYKIPIKGNETGPYSNRRIVYETILIPKPTYVTCMYEVNVRTEYQQQMNDILPPLIIDQKNVVVIQHDGYQYEMFIQADYGITNNINTIGTDERMFTAKVQFKVLGYLTGDGENGSVPKIIRKQNAVNIQISRERVVGRNIGSGGRTGNNFAPPEENNNSNSNQNDVGNNPTFPFDEGDGSGGDKERILENFNLGGTTTDPNAEILIEQTVPVGEDNADGTASREKWFEVDADDLED